MKYFILNKILNFFFFLIKHKLLHCISFFFFLVFILLINCICINRVQWQEILKEKLEKDHVQGQGQGLGQGQGQNHIKGVGGVILNHPLETSPKTPITILVINIVHLLVVVIKKEKTIKKEDIIIINMNLLLLLLVKKTILLMIPIVHILVVVHIHPPPPPLLLLLLLLPPTPKNININGKENMIRNIRKRSMVKVNK